MASWNCAPRYGRSLEQQRRDREQRYRDARAEAATEYAADVAVDGYGDDD